ncbi:hypothetical protein PRZ48_013313 [Zasmidium cellare]|uniref:BTB domain-containing protein n=1 Tax=Zasmidium cellare TaxID=395010 RepID=A0ABR0E3N5_ZASCE|nr:hypothetical protein PRZ48_013313 [Zasmidium cellare]
MDEMDHQPATAPTSAEIDKVSQNGDVVFEAGEPGQQRRILVSSAILTMASTAFAALLGPHFREGQQLGTSQSPVTIPLPEDDPDAMLDLFRLLHLVAVPSLLAADDSKRMQSFAVAADKWCCIDALRLQAQGMLLAAVGQLGTDVTPLGLHMAQLATTAYLFNHQQCFAGLVKRMVLGVAGSYLDIWRQIDEQTLPAQFYCKKAIATA